MKTMQSRVTQTDKVKTSRFCLNLRELTVVPCFLIACWAAVCSLSRYNWAARELYFCWASVVAQLCCRKNWAAFAFPPNCIWRNWAQVQFVSRLVERTKVKWTPRFRWTAEQSMQMNTPYVTDDHVGFFALQSKHVCGCASFVRRTWLINQINVYRMYISRNYVVNKILPCSNLELSADWKQPRCQFSMGLQKFPLYFLVSAFRIVMRSTESINCIDKNWQTTKYKRAKKN